MSLPEPFLLSAWNSSQVNRPRVACPPLSGSDIRLQALTSQAPFRSRFSFLVKLKSTSRALTAYCSCGEVFESKHRRLGFQAGNIDNYRQIIHGWLCCLASSGWDRTLKKIMADLIPSLHAPSLRSPTDGIPRLE